MQDWMIDFVRATPEQCKLPWSGGKDGKWFRCYFCGHKFAAGDEFRWIFTNDGSSAGGNPFTCRKCFEENGGVDGLKRLWKNINEVVKVKFWWMAKHC